MRSLPSRRRFEECCNHCILSNVKPSLVIIGLGNPGKAYERTRHNAGFLAMDSLVKEFGEGEWEELKKFHALVCEGRIGTVPVLFVKPQTFMNRSGETVSKIIEFYKLNPKEQLLVLFDEIDIESGEMRLRMKGGPGTHNGMKSIVERIGEEFPRIKIGFGPQPKDRDLATWILSAMTKDEVEEMHKNFSELPQMLKKFVMEELQDQE